MRTSIFDVIIGAGAAGFVCPRQAGRKRGLKVLLIDHAEAVAGRSASQAAGAATSPTATSDPRCRHKHFVRRQPAVLPLGAPRYTPADFIALVQKHGILSTKAQRASCSATVRPRDLIAMLLAECEAGGVERWQPCVSKMPLWPLRPMEWALAAIKSIPIGARANAAWWWRRAGCPSPRSAPAISAFRVAQQFGLPRSAPPRPGAADLRRRSLGALSPRWPGWRCRCRSSTGGKDRMAFDEDLLFTHRGLSARRCCRSPATGRRARRWHQPGAGTDLPEALAQAKAAVAQTHRQRTGPARCPARLADAWCRGTPTWQRPSTKPRDKALARLAEQLRTGSSRPPAPRATRRPRSRWAAWTRALSSTQQTMECKSQPGLYFIGEVVDVTGWLGGYNFQWAWASAPAPARAGRPIRRANWICPGKGYNLRLCWQTPSAKYQLVERRGTCHHGFGPDLPNPWRTFWKTLANDHHPRKRKRTV